MTEEKQPAVQTCKIKSLRYAKHQQETFYGP